MVTFLVFGLSISIFLNVILYWAFQSASKSDYDNYLRAENYRRLLESTEGGTII